MTELQDKILGSMVGGAVGDALGYTVEFMYYDQIICEYGPNGITRYELNANGKAEISDDTQMSLYTANGLLINDIKAAYIEWFQTQMHPEQLVVDPKCWISKVEDMYSLRAPGMTCMSALGAISCGIEAVNNSKGCGGIMRVAPIALWGAAHNVDIKHSVKEAMEAAKLTHKHTMGWLPAGMLAYMIQKIVENDVKNRDQIVEILNDKAEIFVDVFTLGTAGAMCTFDKETKKAVELAYSDMPDVEAIKKLGEGWTGDEAWYISLYCTLKHFDSFEDAIVAAVNHSGDSDSTGAITGNIMGAIHGYSAIPEHYKTNLELRTVIEQMANDLITA